MTPAVTAPWDKGLPTNKETPLTQLRLIASTRSNENGKNSKLGSAKCTPLRRSLPKSPQLALKVMKLQAQRPDLAAVVESLVNDMLDEIEGRLP